MNARETAVLIPVPQVDPVVDRWRRKYEPGWAKGIPTHVTLCYPFSPPEQVDDELTERLTALFRCAAPFPFWFARTDRFPRDVVARPGAPRAVPRPHRDPSARRSPPFARTAGSSTA